MIVAVGVLGVVALGVLLESRNRLRKHGWHRLAYRWHTGLAWHGAAVAGDEWTWPGPWFWRLHRAKRAAVRDGLEAAVLGDLYLWHVHPQAALLLNVVLGAGLVAGTLIILIIAAATYRHRRRWVRPLHARTADMIGVPKSGPRRHIDVARDRSRVTLKLPQDWTTDLKGRAELARTVAETLGIEAPEVSWRLAGPAPMLTMTTSKPPPDMVRLEDVRLEIDKAKADEIVWGIGKQSQLVKTSLSGDSPHMGVSAGSGAGKSVAARVILAQMLYHGAIALIIDFKMISQHWARGLPNVAIVRRPHEIHEALMWLGEEVNRRNEVALAGADMDGNVHAVVGPRLIIAGEELNATMKVLRMHWRQRRDLDKSLQVRSPALDNFDLVNLMGRQVLMNILYIGQKLSVKASGGDGDIRESIGVIAFGRYTPSNWKMLAGDHAMPPSSKKPGRLQIVSDSVREVQAVFMSAREAHDLALAGTVTPLPAGFAGLSVLGAEQPAVAADVPVVPRTPDLVTLREAFEDLGIGPTRQALERASTRPGFPRKRGQKGLAYLYSALDLAAFAAGEYEPPEGVER